MRRLWVPGGFGNVVPSMGQRCTEARMDWEKELPTSFHPHDAVVRWKGYHMEVLRLRSLKPALDYVQLTHQVADSGSLVTKEWTPPEGRQERENSVLKEWWRDREYRIVESCCRRDD